MTLLGSLWVPMPRKAWNLPAASSRIKTSCVGWKAIATIAAGAWKSISYIMICWAQSYTVRRPSALTAANQSRVQWASSATNGVLGRLGRCDMSACMPDREIDRDGKPSSRTRVRRTERLVLTSRPTRVGPLLHPASQTSTRGWTREQHSRNDPPSTLPRSTLRRGHALSSRHMLVSQITRLPSMRASRASEPVRFAVSASSCPNLENRRTWTRLP
mmetsp:Transcript_3910/g.13851  ORF Transcript_3910/g.13851 Transcript_3910/m.13851 type:complete len:216 (+) Transcript_3910:4441-5088(+)